MFDKLITNLDIKIQELAARYIYKRTQPVYEELGVVIHDAIHAAAHLFEGVNFYSSTVLGAQIGFYNDTFTRLGYGSIVWDSSYPDIPENAREIAKKISLMLSFAESWSKSLLNYRDRTNNERIIRAVALEIHAMVKE